MSAVVIATYIPPKPTDFPPDARPALLGLDFMNLHVRRLRYAHEALFGPQKYLPGWYTRELGGTPFWSNLQNFPLIPIRLVALFARPEDAFGVSVQLAANCAAVFMFLYCRRLGIGRVGCAVAGFTFACSGFFASRVYAGHLPLLEAYPALPLLLWLIEVNARSVAPDRLMPLKLLAAALAAFCIAVAGHPQLPVYAFTMAALYLVFRVRNRRGILIGAAMLLGVGVASFVLLPMLLLIGRSTRVLALDPPGNDLAFPYGRVATLLFPDLHGRMPPDFHGYPNAAYFWDTVCYVGWLPIIACAALLARWVIFGRRPRGVWMFITLAGVLALASALPGWHSVMQQIPGTILRSPSRQVYITTFALAIAAGVGVDLASRFARRKELGAWGLTVIGIAIVLHAWDLGYAHDRKFITAFWAPTRTESNEAKILADESRQQRIAIDYDIWKTYNREMDDVGVFDSILLAKPYRALMEVTSAIPNLNVQRIDGSQVNARANRFFGVRLMLTRTPRRGLETLVSGNGVFLFAVPDPIPRVSLIPLDRTQFLSDDEIHKRLKDQSFDLSNQLLLPEDTPKPTHGTSSATLPHVDVMRPSTDRVKLEVSSPGPAYLRLLDTWDPGWTATVNGASAPVARAYDTFIAIPIPGGNHTIELAYHTPAFRTGMLLSLVSLAGLFALCWPRWRGWANGSAALKSRLSA